MNERIKEFRFEAAEYANEKKPLGLMKWNEIRDAKFVELIVRECAGVVTNDMDHRGNWCGNKILKHFGIEE